MTSVRRLREQGIRKLRSSTWELKDFKKKKKMTVGNMVVLSSIFPFVLFVFCIKNSVMKMAVFLFQKAEQTNENRERKFTNVTITIERANERGAFKGNVFGKA